MIELHVDKLVGGNITITTTPPISPSPYFTYDQNRVITGLVQGSPNEYHSGTYDDYYSGHEDPETGEWLPAETPYSVWSYTGSNVTDSYALEIASYAFSDDLMYQGAQYGKNISGSLSFPNVTRIGDGAFQYCGSLTSITMPNVTSIGYEAFFDCRGLTSVTIGSGIQVIGGNAFSTSGSPIVLTISKTIAEVQAMGQTNQDYSTNVPYSDWYLPTGSIIVCTDGTISIT